MAKDEKDAAAEAPKKKSKMMLIIIIAAVVLLGGGGAGAYFAFFAGDGHEEVVEPEKGVVTALENAITINLADGHYLKLGFALQQTIDAAEAVDLSEAADLAIDQYTGMSVAELSTEKGRAKAKAELLEKLEKAYVVEEKQAIMDIYYTQFVTQ